MSIWKVGERVVIYTVDFSNDKHFIGKEGTIVKTFPQGKVHLQLDDEPKGWLIVIPDKFLDLTDPAILWEV